MNWFTRRLWPRRDEFTHIQADIFLLVVAAQEQNERYDDLRRLIMATAAELIDALNAATDEVAADLQTLKDNLAAALASNDQEVQDAVTAALAGFDAPIARLQALGADVENPVPPVEPA